MNDDYSIVKEIIIQMLASPQWQNQYNSFVDEYCILFNDEEEVNQIQQNNLFKQFQSEMATIYDSYFNSIGMENQDDLQAKVIQDIINSDGDDEIDIQQILAIGDYNVFKAEMSYQNKKRELAAYQQLVDEDEIDQQEDEEEENEIPVSKMDILKLKLDYEHLLEELELKQAMQLSLDTPNQQKLAKLEEAQEVINARLQLLTGENQNLQQQNDRKEKLRAQLNSLPQTDIQKEYEIIEKIKHNTVNI